MNSLGRYAGSKLKYVGIINSLMSQTDAKVYSEPFGGFLSIFLNTQKSFDKYFINDLNPHIFAIYESFKYLNFSDVIEIQSNMLKQFGDWKTSKDSYYNMRNWINENKLNSNFTDKGIYTWILINSYINSLSRFGPNGFNQSFGNRNGCTQLNATQFNDIKYRLSKAEILNISGLDMLGQNDTFYFLDPPYEQANIAGYRGELGIQQLVIDDILSHSYDMIYTDIFHENLKLDFIANHNKKTNSSRPGADNKDNSTLKNEVIYHRFKKPTNITLF